MYTGYISELELGMLLAPSVKSDEFEQNAAASFRLDWDISQHVSQVNNFADLESLSQFLITYPETAILVADCQGLSDEELHHLALVLAQYPHITIYICQSLPSMEFSLGDFSFCADEQQLLQNLEQHNVDSKIQFMTWKQALKVSLYQAQMDSRLHQRISDIGVSCSRYAAGATQLDKSNVVVIDLSQVDDDFKILLDGLSELKHCPPVIVVYQQADRFFKQSIALIQHLNLRLALTVTVDELIEYLEPLAMTAFQATQRYLRQYTPIKDSAPQRVFRTDVQQDVASWAGVNLADLRTEKTEDFYCLCFLDQEFENNPFEQIVELYREGNLDITKLRLVCSYEQLKQYYNSELLHLLQNGLTLVLLATQIRNLLIEPYWLGVFEQAFVPIGLWQQLQTEVIRQDLWRSFTEACSKAEVQIGLIDVPPELAKDYQAQGFDYIVGRVPVEATVFIDK
ncbi:hypothetical protein DBZ36_08355 [Alginatibacterium sediminis]|uniref:Uncharacterized protein n=1 Tax=Alginatibacterium sediminis TaxID=2164068 RepID=A0A420EID2_9ALTE|nr:hypothetical protein [Alginatibacterium sediminis]RKF20440.1 hypothetical protein DBZ36_08355 [Alginatibacterium sediminis]